MKSKPKSLLESLNEQLIELEEEEEDEKNELYGLDNFNYN